MAWRCSGSSNKELVDKLWQAGLLTSLRLREAMESVDRANYLAPSMAASAYTDSPQSIGHGATISAPHMHAAACQHLLDFLQPGMRVLDVGSGSGYLVAVMSALVHDGAVVGMEHIAPLSRLAKDNLQRDGRAGLMQDGRVELVCGDGRKGYPPRAPYDAIHVGAAAPEVPSALVEQLKAPGRMFIPVGTKDQSVYQIDKDAEGKVTMTALFGVRYVPLTDAP